MLLYGAVRLYSSNKGGFKLTTLQITADEEQLAHFMQRIEAGDKIEADDWMPEEYRLTLIKLISMHGMSEIMGALPEKEWVPKAPSLNRKAWHYGKSARRNGPWPAASSSNGRFTSAIWQKSWRFNAGLIQWGLEIS